MKLEQNDQIKDVVLNFELQQNDLILKYCGQYPVNIENNFTKEDNFKSFPPDGILKASELDYFYYIFFKEKIIGFYRITDLFFEGSVELHGSFNKYDTFLIKSYFELTKKFIENISFVVPNKRILSSVHVNNKRAITFLHYLKFEYRFVDTSNKNFQVFEKIKNTP